MSVTTLLETRGETHGRFADNARVGQFLRAYWRSHAAWETMPEQQREALDHIAGKLSRIFSGQATFVDHWRDCAGYSTLAADACPQPELPHVIHNGVVDGNGWHPRVDN